MPETRRLPLRVIVASTVLALLAAGATYVVLSEDEGDGAGTTRGTIQLTPQEDVDPDDAAFTTFDGETVALASLRGGPVVVNFFASYCVPCVKEMPALEEVHQDLSGAVEFLGLAVADRPEEAKALVERTGVTYRTALDKDSTVITALGGIVLPTTVLLGPDGEVVASHSGEISAAELRDLVADHFGVGTAPG